MNGKWYGYRHEVFPYSQGNVWRKEGERKTGFLLRFAVSSTCIVWVGMVVHAAASVWKSGAKVQEVFPFCCELLRDQMHVARLYLMRHCTSPMILLVIWQRQRHGNGQKNQVSNKASTTSATHLPNYRVGDGKRRWAFAFPAKQIRGPCWLDSILIVGVVQHVRNSLMPQRVPNVYHPSPLTGGLSQSVLR